MVMVREEHSYFTLFLSGNYSMFQMTQMQTSYVHVYKKTFNLGKHGYRAYKSVPYGEVDEVMPYLLRRARANSAIVGGATEELTMIGAELKRRFRMALFLRPSLFSFQGTNLDSSRAPNC